MRTVITGLDPATARPPLTSGVWGGSWPQQSDQRRSHVSPAAHAYLAHPLGHGFSFWAQLQPLVGQAPLHLHSHGVKLHRRLTSNIPSDASPLLTDLLGSGNGARPSACLSALKSGLRFRYNVCIMAYGQTGSGKSFTMLGPHCQEEPAPPLEPHGDAGIIPRAAGELFRLISEDASRSPEVDISIVEVYNNDIFDLLANDSCRVASGVKRQVQMTQQGKKAACGLTYQSVRSAAEFLTLVGRGLQLRAKQPTAVHAESSRSHLVITVTLAAAASPPSTEPRQPGPRSPATGRRQSPPVPPRTRGCGLGRAAPDPLGQVHATLQLVDLAGSECVGVSGVTGPALRETSCINRSLAALSDVLGALAEGRGHIPYRNSRLTHLLQDAL
ncbi:hypothetical protein FD754_005923, partial [Muntiacus muntjak]